MTRSAVIPFVCWVAIAFCAGGLVAGIQTRQAIRGWNEQIDLNKSLLFSVNSLKTSCEKTVTSLNATSDSLEKQNAAVEELLAEKRVAWGLPAAGMIGPEHEK